jgi:hypothetical protein
MLLFSAVGRLVISKNMYRREVGGRQHSGIYRSRDRCGQLKARQLETLLGLEGVECNNQASE